MILDQFGREMPSTTAPTPRSIAVRRARIEAQYDAAITTSENAKHWRWTDNWSAALANNRQVRETLRERSRYEVANNSFAYGIVDTLANDVIGTGPRLQMRTPDRVFNKAVEAKFNAWSKRIALAAKLRTARRARIVDGESFVMMANDRRRHDRLTLSVRVVECDQFDDPHETMLPSHVAGVYFDDDQQAVGYDMLTSHPGDPYGHALTARRVDRDTVIHWFKSDRPGQVRGIPEITPALPLFAMLRRYTLAVLLAAETAADFAAILETVTAPFDEDGNPIVDDMEPFDLVEIDRGMMTSVPRGWKMNQFKPEQPVTTYSEFRNAILNEIARCIHMPANRARCDSSGYNYASGQLDHGPYHDCIAIDRESCSNEVVDEIFGWWLDEATLIPGYLPAFPAAEMGLDHAWYWNGHQHGDPAKQANAAKTLHDLGLLTDEAYLLEQGIDPEEHFRQLKEQHERRAELAKIDLAAGIPMPGKPTAKPSTSKPKAKRTKPTTAATERAAA